MELAQPIAAESLAPTAEDEAGDGNEGRTPPKPQPKRRSRTSRPPKHRDKLLLRRRRRDGGARHAAERTTRSWRLIKERYPGGAVKVEREMTQDADGNYVLHGAWRQFDEQGRLIMDGRHEHNQKVGLWRKFYRGNEAPLLATSPYKDFTAPFISQANFHNGQLHGKWMISDSKQRKVHEIEFCDGQRNGKATWYYPNGAIMLQAQYEHGRVNGDVMKFAPDSIADRSGELSGRPQAGSRRSNSTTPSENIKKLETTFLARPLGGQDAR